MNKSIHWSMKNMLVKRSVIKSTDAFSPLVNQKVPSNIRKLVGIIQEFVKQDEKLTHSLTMSVLMLIFYNTILGQSKW